MPRQSSHIRLYLLDLAAPAYLLSAMLLLAGCSAGDADLATGSRPAFEVVGHRGARGLLPENSIPSFRRALELGAHTIEIDVVVSRDSQVVVSHEPWMHHVICSTPDGEAIREADARSLNIYEMPYAEIEGYDCGSRGHPEFPRQDAEAVGKPLLREVIEMGEQFARDSARPLPRYNVEIKSNPAWNGTYAPPPARFAQLVYGVLKAEGVTARSIVQSFDPRPLREIHRLDPTLELALLVGTNTEGTLSRQISNLGFVPDGYNPNYRLVDDSLLAAAHGRGMTLIPWTVNTLEEMRRLKDLGVDGVITDYPDLARELLRDGTAPSE